MAHQCASFDFRVAQAELQRRWTDERRATYLLRKDVGLPLSADRLVWPSPLSESATPDWVGPLSPLWSQLPDLREFSANVGVAGVLVAVTIPEELPVPQTAAWREALLSASPGAPSLRWHFLGHDVVDAGLLSPLMNCGYLDDASRQVAAHAWGPYLNSHHLFTDKAAAAEFTKESDARVPEHAPFFVVGLWEVE